MMVRSQKTQAPNLYFALNPQFKMESAEIVVELIMLYGHLIGGSEPERSTATSTTMGCMCKAPLLTLEKVICIYFSINNKVSLT